MGYNVFAAGAFGLLLSDHTEKLGELYDQFISATTAWEADQINGVVPIDEACTWEEAWPPLAAAWTPQIIAQLRKAGILIPDGASLHWTADADVRPGRTATDSDEWVLGFGLYTMPWEYPPMDESFRRIAQWHTWVTGG